MYKQPLFGEDSSPHITSMMVSAIVTLVCWIIFCVLCLVIKFKPQTPQYKEVQIVLSSTPVVEKEKAEAAESASAQVFEENLESSQSEQLPESTPVVPEATSVVPEALEGPAKVETPPAQTKAEPTPAPAQASKTAAPSTSSGTPKTTKASTPSPKATDPAKKVNFDDYQYATDLSQGVDFNKTTTKKQDFDWSQFENSSEPEPQISQKVDKVVGPQSEFSGSAGQTSTNKNQTQTSQASTKTPTQQSASSATNTALSNIRNTTYSTSSGSNTKSITEAKTSKGADGTLSMSMTDGTTRVLLEPIPPVIRLSEAAAALIETSRTVTIEFQVLASGNVPRAQIKITPESKLPQAVRNEIYDQLCNWLFETSSSAARATFEYTIEKR